MNRQAIEWAAKQIKHRSTVDLVKPSPEQLAETDPHNLWLDRGAGSAFIVENKLKDYSIPKARITGPMRSELRRMRKASGLTGAELCRRVGLHDQYVGQIESGNLLEVRPDIWSDLLGACRDEIDARLEELLAIREGMAA